MNQTTTTPRWRTLALFLLFALCLTPTMACQMLQGGGTSSASASPVIDRIQSSRTLRVGMTGDYPPMNVLDRNGELMGLEVDLANALAASLGVEAVFVTKPFDQLLPALEAGSVDIVMAGVTMTPERNLKVAFAGPYFISGKGVLARADATSTFQDSNRLDSGRTRLTALAGTTSEEYVRRSLANASLKTTATYEEAINLVLNDEADALIADYPICLLALLRNPDAPLAAVVAPQSFEPIGIGLPANDPLLANLLQNYLTMLEGVGLMEQLRAKWMDDPSWLANLPD